MRYFKITPKLFLTEQFVDSQTQKSSAAPVNHIWIYDRSGSMHHLLPQLATDLKAKAKEIPVGDTITLGWFSGEGSHNFMLKGFKITEARDYYVLEATIDANKNSMNTTCFSEILHDTDQVVKDLSMISKRFAMCFFTDGYPVVNNYSKEISDIHKAIEKIGSKISSSLLVGYGDYYNKALMSEMAEKLGGAMIHSGSLPMFSQQLTGFLKDSRENDLKLKVVLQSDVTADSLVFGVNGNQVNLYDAGREIEFVPTRGGHDSVYILTSKAPRNAEEVKLPEGDLIRPTNRESMIRGLYAAALVLTQKAKSDVALEVLGSIGDKAMIDTINNAFTNTEYGQAEARIQSAITQPKHRFEQGIKPGYLPKADAFCLLDLVKILMQDEEAYFYPNHPEFEYKRIGVGSKTKPGYPSFKADPDAKCSFGKLSWNKTKLNLSVLAQIHGTVELQEDFKEHGFTNPYPTYVYRNFALVKDGFLNIPRLPVTASVETMRVLASHGVVDGKNGVTILDLTKIPVINRSIAGGRTSAKALCQKVYQELEIEGKLKALNFLHDQFDPDGKSRLGKGALTADQELYLESQGITRNGFNPPVDKLPATDFYMAKDFEVKMKGLSSLPPVKDVLAKTMDGKKLSPSALLVKAGLDLFDSNLKKSASVPVKLAFLEDEVKTLKQELIAVRSDIQETKFAVVLGKKWFDEFPSREKSNLTLNGVEFTLSLEESKVEL